MTSNLTECVCVWLDTTTADEEKWIVSRDQLDAKGQAETTTTLSIEDDEDAALEAGKVQARKLGLPLYRNPETGPAEYLTREIRISGNWRKNGPSNEWAGTGRVDKFGAVECAAELDADAYEQIEEQIADGEYEGEVTVEAEDGREVTYSWSMDW